MQYPLKHADYPFLKYDSFLCASSVIERSVDVISSGINDGTTTIIGRLKDEHVKDVIDMVRKSKVISNKQKQMFFS